MATATGLGRREPKHGSGESRAFPEQIEATVPAGLDIHLVRDDEATHETGPIRDRPAERLRRHVHVTPPGSDETPKCSRSEGSRA